ncbi:hypothetical protein CYLTODRAFT_495353 [Cylindrobasidium torrendii FP15055 ss-10]|uniref:DUF6593 domain-containing protein n=1 Tax=Cylindrobasidium torrendii FP15055 ss-10 TaxID=1314674 RepID=A0A0D7AVD6_9AGAR|nr:hypothetical protein CYLTODRAFT_495353 [Cylindrobasidium torrendii FP15055 ss-10]
MRLYLLDGTHVANQAFTDASGRILYTTSTTKGVTTISRAILPRVRSESTTSSRSSSSAESSGGSSAVFSNSHASAWTDSSSYEASSSSFLPSSYEASFSSASFAPSSSASSRRSTSSLSSVSTTTPPTPRLLTPKPSRADDGNTLRSSSRLRLTAQSKFNLMLTRSKSHLNSSGSCEGATSTTGRETPPTRARERERERVELSQSWSRRNQTQSQGKNAMGGAGMMSGVPMPMSMTTATTRKAPIAHITQTRSVASIMWAPRGRPRSIASSSATSSTTSSSSLSYSRFSDPDSSACTMLTVGGREVRAADVWRKPGPTTNSFKLKKGEEKGIANEERGTGNAKQKKKGGSSKREWVAEDGKVYVWDVKWWKPRLTAADSDTPTATFTRPFLAAVASALPENSSSMDSRKAYLDIAAEAEGMADMILTGFVYMEVTRQKKEGTSHA